MGKPLPTFRQSVKFFAVLRFPWLRYISSLPAMILSTTVRWFTKPWQVFGLAEQLVDANHGACRHPRVGSGSGLAVRAQQRNERNAAGEGAPKKSEGGRGGPVSPSRLFVYQKPKKGNRQWDRIDEPDKEGVSNRVKKP